MGEWRCAFLKGLLISPCNSLEFYIQLGCIFPFSPSIPHLFVKSPQATTLPSCISFYLDWFSVTASCDGFEWWSWRKFESPLDIKEIKPVFLKEINPNIHWKD